MHHALKILAALALTLSPLAGREALGQPAGTFVPRSAAATGRPSALTRELHRAEVAFRSGSSLLEAKARLDRVLTADPDDADARRLRAHVLLAQGRPDAALEDADRAADLRPADAEALLLVCEAARLTGARAHALAALERVARLTVRDAPLHARLAWNAAELGDLERAEAFARIAVQQDARLPAAYVQLARVFVLQRQDEAAAATLVRGATARAVDRRTSG